MDSILVSLIAFLIIILTGCKESYPEIEYDDSYLNKELSTLEGSNAPNAIIPVFGDPEYSILTRGSGVFYNYMLDPDHWRNAEFRTFAFLTDNSFSRSEHNGYAYYANTDTLHTLLYNQRMKLVDGTGQVMFVDSNGIKETKYYNFNHQNWKYKFFTYYADDCADESTLKRTNDNNVKIDLDIDGSQDIIHSFAYHTEEQIEKAISVLPSQDDQNTIRNYGQEIFYSSLAGHHQIHPIFNANHLLSRFDFQIRGVEADSISDFYKHVVVRSVSIKSKYHGVMTVADDKWDKDSYNIDLGNNSVLVFDDDTKYLSLQMDTLRCDDADNGGWTELTKDSLYTYKPNDAQFHVSSTALKSLGKPILLPPAIEYEVHVAIDFLDYDDNDPSNVKLKRKPYSLGEVVYNIKYQDPSTKEYTSFIAGHVYNIIIGVYGPQQISATLNLKNWIDADSSIVVGGDEEDK